MLGNEPDGGSLLVVTDGAENKPPFIKDVREEVSLQYKHLIPAPVHRTYTSARLYKHPWITFQKHNSGYRFEHANVCLRSYFIGQLSTNVQNHLCAIAL